MEEVSLPPPPNEIVKVVDPSGRVLLLIRADGTWEIGPEDAPEAARIFAAAVAEHLAPVIR